MHPRTIGMLLAVAMLACISVGGSGFGAHVARADTDPGCAVVQAGSGNEAGSGCATVGGGQSNSAPSSWATIGGGYNNRASGESSTIGGGRDNWAPANDATVSGGRNNFALFRYASVGGGYGNKATANFATIGGGGPFDLNDENTGNRVTDDYGTIGGGTNNMAGNSASTVTDAAYATVAGGGKNTASGNSSTVGGGSTNTASAIVSTVGGGYLNVASAEYATVSGGGFNTAQGARAAIAGGNANTASGAYSSIGGGASNRALGTRSTVGGGGANLASNNLATVAGGYANRAQGAYATVPGGSLNYATGANSFAAGTRAKANHQGSFVWGDSTATDVASTANNQFIVRASGGVKFFSNAGATAGVQLPAGGGAWASLSDRNAKANISAVDSTKILTKLAQIPVQIWNYKTQDASVKHIGPMAQDFAAAFGVGEDNTHISTVDADGVALAAIQGLYREGQAKDAQIAKQQGQITELQARLTVLEQTRQPLTTAGVSLQLLVMVMMVTSLSTLLIGAGIAFMVMKGRRRTSTNA